MRKLSRELLNHIAGEITTLTQCYYIRRRDRAEFYLTDYQTDLIIDGVIYRSSNNFSSSTIDSSANLSVDNLEIEGVIDSSWLKEEDIVCGLYDYSYIEIFMVNYCEQSPSKLVLKSGYIGEIRTKLTHFTAEICGISQKLATNLGQLYAPLCRVDFGSAKCGVNLERYKKKIKLLEIIDERRLRIEYQGGIVFDYSGGMLFHNSGEAREIKELKGDIILLAESSTTALQVNDEASITPGCNKQFSTCCYGYDNAINFRGEPHLPGLDEMLKTAGTFR